MASRERQPVPQTGPRPKRSREAVAQALHKSAKRRASRTAPSQTNS
jgi:hypothetical protein